MFVSFDPSPLGVSKNSVLDRLLKRVAGDHVRQPVSMPWVAGNSSCFTLIRQCGEGMRSVKLKV
jgi:hypothetical protein